MIPVELVVNTRPVTSPAAMDDTVALAVVPGTEGQRHFLLGVSADYSATVSAVKDVTVKVGTIPDTGLVTATVLARGSTDTAVGSTAFQYAVARTQYAKAAVAAGTALAAGTIPADKWGLYRLSINASGTFAFAAAAANFTTGYASEAAAIAAIPSTPAGSVDVGYVTVLTAGAQAFVGGTDALAGGASGNPATTTNYSPASGVSFTSLYAPHRHLFTNGEFILPLPGIVHADYGQGLAVEIAASGTGGTTGRVTAFVATA